MPTPTAVRTYADAVPVAGVSPLPHLPPTHVPRRRLVEALPAESRIVCVVAGAGWGKTALLRELCDRTGAPVAWVGRDGDVDGSPFPWHRVLRATATAISAGEARHGLLERAPDGASDARLMALGDAIEPGRGSDDLSALDLAADLADAIGERAVTIVVDDLHAFDAVSVASWWRCVEALPSSVTVLLGSRHEHSFPLAAWGLRDDVHVVRQHDLALDHSEIAALVERITSIRPGHDEVERLAGVTEGWPASVEVRCRAGLDVAPGAGVPTRPASRPESGSSDITGSDITGSDVTGSHGTRAAGTRSVDHPHDGLESVLRDVIDSLEPELRRFVLDTSVLEVLTPESCHALTGRADAGAVLRDLVRRSVFTERIDGPADRYRYHHLFQRMLRHELEHHDPERWRAMHTLAAEHCLARDAVGAAAAHLVDIGEHVSALATLLEHHATVMEAAQYLELAPLLDRVPLPAVADDRERILDFGLLMATGGQVALGRQLAVSVRCPDLDPRLAERLRWVDLLAGCVLGDVDEADLERRPERPPEPAVAHFWRELPIALVLGDRFDLADEAWADGLATGMPNAGEPLVHTSTEAFLEAWRGRITSALPLTIEAEEGYRAASVRMRAAYVRIGIARCLVDTELDDPLQAAADLEAAHAAFDGRVEPYTSHDVPLWCAVLRAWRLGGEPDRAVARGLELVDAIGPARPRLRSLVAEEIVRSATALGDTATVRAALEHVTGSCARAIASARAHLAAGDLRAARQSVAGLGVDRFAEPSPFRALELLDVRFRSSTSERERDELATVGRRLADEHGLVRSWWVAVGHEAPEAGGRPGTRDGSHPIDPAPLSERELDVLRGLVAGLPHRQVAELLAVSPNTLKTHLRTVYRKLGAVDRADAIRRARSAGIIPNGTPVPGTPAPAGRPAADPAAGSDRR